jgi:hypothetical protein
MHIITRNGKMYVFKKKDNLERDDMFMERVRFIVDHIHKESFDYVERMSYVYVHVKMTGVVYEPNIMSQLDRLVLG